MHTRQLSLAFLLSATLVLPLRAQAREPQTRPEGQRTRPERPERLERPERPERPERSERRERRERLRTFLRASASAEQKALLQAESQAARTIVENARAQARKLREASGNDPKLLRERLTALRNETLDTLTPAARRLVGSLTPEQRERLAARAERHGRTFDEARLTERLARLLARGAARHTRGERGANATR